MSTPTQCVFDLTPPRRPGLDDVGGGAKINDPRPGFQPDPLTMPTAEDENQAENLLVRFGSVVPHTVITLHLDGSNNFVINKVTSCKAGVSTTSGNPFTVTQNGGAGSGDATISWAANTFPPAVADHYAVLTGATSGVALAETLTNSVRVRTKSMADALAPRTCDVFLM
jgi:hypothetical protein